MTPLDTPMVDSPNTMPSYFDIAKPVSIPTNASAQYSHGFSSMLANQDMDEDALPEYLQSFQDSGISDARLKQFTWLHPKNYSSEGSLSDDYTLSPYGTSVSSPRGDEWEIIENGPRKSIDELWDEVFEYQQRVKLLERAHLQHHQAQDSSGLQAQLDTCDDYHVSLGGPSSQTPTTTTTATTTASLFGNTVGGSMTQVDKTAVYATRKGVRSDHGATRSLLQMALQVFPRS